MVLPSRPDTHLPINASPSPAHATFDSRAQMKCLIEKYSRESSVPSTRPLANSPAVFSVLLTGSTGNLGSDVLALVLGDPRVVKVYALNRRSSEGPSFSRVAARFKSKGLDVGLLKSSRAVFVDGDTALPNLGLLEDLYDEIRTSVTTIIHNAWPINLSQSLSFFEPHLLGLRNLIELAHSSPNSSKARFLFISSFSSSQSWDHTSGLMVPEEVLTNPDIGVGLGYGESKFIAEQIVSRSGLEATSLRLIQCCGRLADGAWSPQEWVSILVKESFNVGALPMLAGLVSFLPLDVAAQCIHDIAFSRRQLPPILNLRHPRPFKWELLINAINRVAPEMLGAFPLPAVSFSDWVSILERRAKQPDTSRANINPAHKLLSAFRGIAQVNNDIVEMGTQDVEHFPRPTLAIEEAQEFSPTLRNLQQLGPQDARRWIEYWITSGFLELRFYMGARL